MFCHWCGIGLAGMHGWQSTSGAEFACAPCCVQGPPPPPPCGSGPTIEDMRRRLRNALRCSLPSCPAWRQSGSSLSSDPSAEPELTASSTEPRQTESSPISEPSRPGVYHPDTGWTFSPEDRSEVDTGASYYNSRPTTHSFASAETRAPHWTEPDDASSLPTNSSASPHGTLQHHEPLPDVICERDN